MIVPEFIRFYSGYTLQTVMNEFAVSFFTLVNSMYRLKAKESLALIQTNFADESTLNALKKDSDGISAIVREIKVLENVN